MNDYLMNKMTRMYSLLINFVRWDKINFVRFFLWSRDDGKKSIHFRPIPDFDPCILLITLASKCGELVIKGFRF